MSCACGVRYSRRKTVEHCVRHESWDEVGTGKFHIVWLRYIQAVAHFFLDELWGKLNFVQLCIVLLTYTMQLRVVDKIDRKRHKDAKRN